MICLFEWCIDVYHEANGCTKLWSCYKLTERKLKNLDYFNVPSTCLLDGLHVWGMSFTLQFLMTCYSASPLIRTTLYVYDLVDDNQEQTGKGYMALRTKGEGEMVNLYAVAAWAGPLQSDAFVLRRRGQLFIIKKKLILIWTALDTHDSTISLLL